ncbi:hypothetical protein FD755_016405, partial [Muntiacus reevesi]
MILGRKLTGKAMKFLLFIFVGVHLLSLASGKAIHGNGTSQRTFQEIKEEIAHYGDVAKAIINFTVYGKGQNRSYERLALLVDTVGPRLSGSKSLEKAIEIMQQNLQGDGLENVHLEPVKIPHWERGEESAVMLEPRIHKMAILGLGSSIGTPPEGMICFFKSFPYHNYSPIYTLVYIPKSEIACGYHNSLFNFQRNCQAVFQIDHTILHFHSCSAHFLPLFPPLSLFFRLHNLMVSFSSLSVFIIAALKSSDSLGVILRSVQAIYWP